MRSQDSQGSCGSTERSGIVVVSAFQLSLCMTRQEPINVQDTASELQDAEKAQEQRDMAAAAQAARPDTGGSDANLAALASWFHSHWGSIPGCSDTGALPAHATCEAGGLPTPAPPSPPQRAAGLLQPAEPSPDSLPHPAKRRRVNQPAPAPSLGQGITFADCAAAYRREQEALRCEGAPERGQGPEVGGCEDVDLGGVARGSLGRDSELQPQGSSSSLRQLGGADQVQHLVCSGKGIQMEL